MSESVFEVTSLENEYTKLLKKRVKEVLEEDTKLYLSKDEYGMFYYEIYADYRDKIDDSMIKDIMKSKCPIEVFDEWLYDSYLEVEVEAEGEVLDMLEEDEEIQRLVSKINNSDILRDTLFEVFYVHLPSKHFLEQDVQIDIIVDTGDANSDYTLNCVYPHYNGEYGEVIDDKASILWLAKQQGYKKSELNKALRNGEYNDSKFLKSVKVEVENCSTHMNALVFCVEMTLEEAINFQERIQKESELNKSYNPKERKGTDFITINKEATCGLYDCWNGAGGCLEIELEKDVILPIKYIDSALPDGCRGYSIDAIYSPINIWRNGSVA